MTELLNLFDNLSFDLRDKICREVGYIKEIEKTKNNHKKLMRSVIIMIINMNWIMCINIWGLELELLVRVGVVV